MSRRSSIRELFSWGLAAVSSVALAAHGGTAWAGDGACLPHLERAERTRHQATLPATERFRALDAAMTYCSAGRVSPELEARAALLFRFSPSSGDGAKRVEMLTDVLERLRRAGTEGIEEVHLLEAIGSLQGELGQAAASMETIDEAFRRRCEVFGSRSPQAAWGAFLVAATYSTGARTGQPDPKKALSVVEPVVMALLEDRGEEDPVALQARLQLADHSRAAGRIAEADAIEGWYAERRQRMSREERLHTNQLLEAQWQ